MSNSNKEHLQDVLVYYLLNGKDATIMNFKISEESLNRYIRSARKKLNLGNATKLEVLTKISEQYDDSELKILAKGKRTLPSQENAPRINFSGQHIKFGAMGDTHIGSIFTDDDWVLKAFKEMKKEGVEFICHVGDLTEGMSNRAGHIYELSYLGYEEQKKHAIKLLSEASVPLYIIDGNHDRWYIKSNGALIVKDICENLPNATFLGHDEGDIELKNNAVLKLWHGEDGNSYATSYRLQKIAESLTGGEKPNIMLCGHTHKTIWMPNERNIEMFSCGSVQKQSKWMRGKRIAAHTGFWIIDLWLNNLGISACQGKWYPFYS